jgi:ankyrin repeat protein
MTQSSLSLSLLDDDYNVARSALDAGAELEFSHGSENMRSETVLIMAVMEGNYDMAKRLIDFGDRIDATDSEGHTPLLIACDDGHYDISKLLIDNGSDVNYQGEYKCKPLTFEWSQDITDLLVSHGATHYETDDSES